MAKPRKVVRPIEKNISLDEVLVASVEARLFSELEGRTPHGAWSRYVKSLIQKDLEGKSAPLKEIWILSVVSDMPLDVHTRVFQAKPTLGELCITGVPMDVAEKLRDIDPPSASLDYCIEVNGDGMLFQVEKVRL